MKESRYWLYGGMNVVECFLCEQNDTAKVMVLVSVQRTSNNYFFPLFDTGG